MKKIFVLGLSILAFSGCSFMDMFVDSVAVHNELVQRMDEVLAKEEGFYDQYWALADNADTKPLSDAYDAFKSAVNDLDKFFTDTKFASDQQAFVDKYNKDYKGFIQEYVKYAGEFVDKVKKDGFTYAGMESYFEKLDQYTVDYVKAHNGLIDVINIQSDTAVTGQSY